MLRKIKMMAVLTPFVLAIPDGAWSDEARVERLLSQMTLEEKIYQLHAHDKFFSGGVERLGVPKIVMSDGPHGVRGDVLPHSWVSANRAEDQGTYLPVGTVLSATWNPLLARRFGETLGAEARFRGKDIILGPGINIVRTPLNGRNFEYQGEDPYLISELVVPLIQGIQSQDVAACVKHYALNNQELNRLETDVRLDERALREIYLPGYEAALLRGHSRSLMCAYNRFRGESCAQNRYLVRDILRGEWNSDAVLITDWNVLNIDTIDASYAGLDIEMGTNKPYDEYAMANPLLAAVTSGVVPMQEIDAKVRRILRMMDECNMLEPEKRLPGSFNTPEHHQAAREIAREGIVLLQNKNESLPLVPEKTKHIVVVGANAVARHHAGGGSSMVPASYEITPLDGLKERFGDTVKIDYFKGFRFAGDERMETIPPEVIASRAAGSGVPAWRVDLFGNPKLEGEPGHTSYVGKIAFKWGVNAPHEGLPKDGFSARATGQIIPLLSGTYELISGSDDGSRIYLDGKLVADGWLGKGYSEVAGKVELVAGKTYTVVVEFVDYQQGARWYFGWVTPDHEKLDDAHRARMLAAAEQADAVLFFGGINKVIEQENIDRENMKLPAGQNELIESLVKVNPNTQVYLVAGSALEMTWKDKVAAIVWVGYAGMETGRALADLVSGDFSPSGHMPYTLHRQLEDVGAHALDAYQPNDCLYKEGIFVGYRWTDKQKIEPLFPFGHGLTYSAFTYSNLQATPDGSRISFTVANTGKRRAAAVPQLYVHDVECSVERPVRELKSFQKIELNPGESREVVMELADNAFAFFDPILMKWHVEAGAFELAAGESSRDLRLKTKVDRKESVLGLQ